MTTVAVGEYLRIAQKQAMLQPLMVEPLLAHSINPRLHLVGKSTAQGTVDTGQVLPRSGNSMHMCHASRVRPASQPEASPNGLKPLLDARRARQQSRQRKADRRTC